MAPAKKTAAATGLTTISKPQAPAVKEVIPEYLQRANGAAAAGFEEADKEDFILPRLSICQALTPQRQKYKPNYIAGLNEGDFFNTVTGEIYGPKVSVVPLFLTKQRIKFRGKIGEGIDCSSPNGKTLGQLHPTGCRTCPHAQWGTGKDGGGQACTEFKNIVVLLSGHSEPILFSNKSTAIGVTKQWLSMMKMSGLDMFASTYDLQTETTVKQENEFYTYSFRRTGFVPAVLYNSAKQFFESLHDKDITFNVDELEAEDLADAGNPDGAF